VYHMQSLFNRATRSLSHLPSFPTRRSSDLKFDGTPLFPERIAHTVPYKLSDAEAALYKAVTDYVREEFNRAEALQNDKRTGTVRSEEHTSELQSRENLVCRLLLEKKKKDLD